MSEKGVAIKAILAYAGELMVWCYRCIYAAADRSAVQRSGVCAVRGAQLCLGRQWQVQDIIGERNGSQDAWGIRGHHAQAPASDSRCNCARADFGAAVFVGGLIVYCAR